MIRTPEEVKTFIEAHSKGRIVRDLGSDVSVQWPYVTLRLTRFDKVFSIGFDQDAPILLNLENANKLNASRQEATHLAELLEGFLERKDVQRTKEEIVNWIKEHTTRDTQIETNGDYVITRWKNGVSVTIKGGMSIYCDYLGNEHGFINFVNDCIPIMDFVLKLGRYLKGEEE